MNPIDGDEIVIDVGIRDGRIAAIGSEGIRVGVTSLPAGGEPWSLWFRTGEEARTLGGETFAGCEVARRAVLALPGLFIGRSIEDGLAVGVGELLKKMGDPPVQDERCVVTVLAAARTALINAHVSVLAEATVAMKRLRLR